TWRCQPSAGSCRHQRRTCSGSSTLTPWCSRPCCWSAATSVIGSAGIVPCRGTARVGVPGLSGLSARGGRGYRGRCGAVCGWCRGRGVHGFAPALTSFVGRAGAVAEVAGLLKERRLVTVTGPGGSGKTRLAAEVVGRVAGWFADGVWLAELAAVRDPAQVPAVVAAVLGVGERPGEPAAEAVARVLAGQQLLLVLDNCEHLIGAAAGLCAG